MAEIILHATPAPPRAPAPSAASAARARSPASCTAWAPTRHPHGRLARAARRAHHRAGPERRDPPRARRRARTPTLVKDMQRHPVRRNVLHVDFLRVDLDKTVDVEVPITLEGEAEAVTREGGVVDQMLTVAAHHRQAERHPVGPHHRHLRPRDRPRAARQRHRAARRASPPRSTPRRPSSPASTACPMPTSCPRAPRARRPTRAPRAKRAPRARAARRPRPSRRRRRPATRRRLEGGDEG